MWCVLAPLHRHGEWSVSDSDAEACTYSTIEGESGPIIIIILYQSLNSFDVVNGMYGML